jgi:hypothetical protein
MTSNLQKRIRWIDMTRLGESVLVNQLNRIVGGVNRSYNASYWSAYLHRAQETKFLGDYTDEKSARNAVERAYAAFIKQQNKRRACER